MQIYQLPILPINNVICPKGMLFLRVVKKRYNEIVKACPVEKISFGIVALLSDQETALQNDLPFINIGTAVEIIEMNEGEDGLVMLKCKGTHRIKVHSPYIQNNDFFISGVSDIENDLRMGIPEDLRLTSRVLKEVLKSVVTVKVNICEPYDLENASWVSNRWTEMLSLPLIQKQRLMELESPIVRLELVQDILEHGFHK